MKKYVCYTFILLGCVLFLIHLILPGVLDKKFNKISVPPPYTLTPRADSLFRSLDFIADLHCDALLWDRDLTKRHSYGAVDIPRMLEGNMALQAFTIVTKAPKNLNFENNTGQTDQITLPYILQGRPVRSWFDLTERAITQCKALQKAEQRSNGSFRIIRSKNDFEDYLISRRSNPAITAGMLGIEGLHALGGKIENVDRLYDEGVRMMAAVHFFDNKLGGSAHGVSKGGLSDFGRAVIKKMQKKHIIVDVAHNSPSMIDDILAISQKPVVSSHTGVVGTCKTIRNLSDKQIKGITATGGLIGIAMFAPATCDHTPASTAKAIKYCIDLVGADYVALGSDFDGAIETHTDVSGLKVYIEEMLKLGIAPGDIKKVMGENVRDFLLDQLPPES